MPKEKANYKSNDAYVRSQFWHGLSTVGDRVILNWSLYVTAALTLSLVLILICTKKFGKVHAFLIAQSMTIFSCSVGALSMILAAIAVAVVIYNKRDLHIIVTTTDKAAEGFIFPYRYGASIWAILALVSFTSNLLPSTKWGSVYYITNVLWLFWTFYCIIFTLYLIGEIIQHMLLSAIVEEK